MRDEALEKQVRSLYGDLPYHNFAHALEAVTTGEAMVRRCQEEGIRIDPEVVYYALLFHDAGYHEDHTALGYATKEQYSADLAERLLSDRGLRRRRMDKVRQAIIATTRDAEFVTPEDKTVRAADLAGLAADYEIFRANAEKLRQEQEWISGRPVPWSEWRRSVADTMRFYLRQHIRLTSGYADALGDSLFHRRAKANLERLLAEAD